MTLVDLLVYSVLLLIVVAITGALLLSGLRTQRTTVNVGSATTRAQAALSDIERAVRNASEAKVYAASGSGFGVVSGGGSGNLLITKTRIAEAGSSTASWRCARWYYDSTRANPDGSTGALLSSTYSPVTTSVAAITVATAKTWSRVTSASGPVTGTGVFTQQARGVAISLNATIQEHAPVALESTATTRAQNDTTGSGTCLP
jgi:type II secretory pathway pseudopilin PulG